MYDCTKNSCEVYWQQACISFGQQTILITKFKVRVGALNFLPNLYTLQCTHFNIKCIHVICFQSWYEVHIYACSMQWQSFTCCIVFSSSFGDIDILFKCFVFCHVCVWLQTYVDIRAKYQEEEKKRDTNMIVHVYSSIQRKREKQGERGEKTTLCNETCA